MIVISDTSVISNLLQIQQINLLPQLYGKIIIPTAVYEELSFIPKQKIFIDAQDWISIVAASENKMPDLLDYLDKGEAEAITIYKEIKADLLLIDELRGRTIARNMGIPVIGILGMIIRAKEFDLIKSVKDLVDALISTANFRIHPKLYKQILTQVNE